MADSVETQVADLGEYVADLQRQVEVLARLCVRRELAEVYKPEGVEIWLKASNPSLGGKSPNDLLARGEFVTVLGEIERLQEGVFA